MGSNLGDRRENLLAALRLLDDMKGMEIGETSSIYETEPWGVLDQPSFLNMVAMAHTSRDPRGVLEACREVEKEMGRVRERKWGPRIIDVDILLYDDIQLEQQDLVIPHPRMLEREFVLVPLLELRPEMSHPEVGRLSDYPGPHIDDKAIKAFEFGKEEWHG